MIVFFDIDGTLVDEKTQILPSSAAEAVRALKANGHIPIVNTGRPYAHIDPRVRALPFDGCVAAGGAQVLLNGVWLKNQRIENALLPKIVEAVRRCRLQVLYEAEHGYFLDGEFSAHHPEIARQCDALRRFGCFVRDVRTGFDDPLVKFCTFDTPESDTPALTAALSPWFDSIDRRGMTEFVPRGNSKAASMARILDALGCPIEQTAAIGDSANDIPMLRAAGVGIAMGNAVPQAKDCADFVTDSVLDDGIYHALKHFAWI